jgi:cytochrome c oxidase assembly factor CtaG
LTGAFGAPLVASVAALASYGSGFRRLRGRGRRRVSGGQALLFVLGIAAGLTAVSPPFDAAADDRLSLHMLQHLLLGDVAPLLLVAGVRGPMSVFALPRVLVRALGRSRQVTRLLHAALAPRTSLVLWAGAVAGWHVPAAYDLALAHESVHALEHASFAAAGLLVWVQIIAPFGRPRLGAGGRALFAGAVLGLGMIASEVLLVTGSLYPHYGDAADQHRAALLMMGEQIATLGTAAALLVWAHVESVAGEVSA